MGNPACSERLALTLFGSLRSSPEDDILLRMSLRESDPGLTKIAELLGSQPERVRNAFLEPMLRWGASETYEPMRQQERAMRLSSLVRSTPYFCIPVSMWSHKPVALPSLPMRLLFWAMAMAATPLSIFGFLIIETYFAFQSNSPQWLSISAAAAMPIVLVKIEYSWLLRRKKPSIPHRAANKFFAPTPQRLDRIAQAARSCFFERALACKPLGAQLQPAVFLARLPRSTAWPMDDEVGFACLDIFLAELESQGMAPGIDAALAALASQETEALDDAIGLGHPSSRPARARSL